MRFIYSLWCPALGENVDFKLLCLEREFWGIGKDTATIKLRCAHPCELKSQCPNIEQTIIEQI